MADEYVSALPVDVLKRVVPEAWSTLPYFRQLDELEGIPVMNRQLWFDTKFESRWTAAFRAGPALSVHLCGHEPALCVCPESRPSTPWTRRLFASSPASVFMRTCLSAARSTPRTRRCWN